MPSFDVSMRLNALARACAQLMLALRESVRSILHGPLAFALFCSSIPTFCSFFYVFRSFLYYTMLFRDPAKKKDDGKPKQRDEMKSKKAKERKEDEGEWETVVKRPTGQMTKQVISTANVYIYFVNKREK